MSWPFGRARLGFGLLSIVGLAVVGNPQPAAAQFSYTVTAGPQADQTASLATPSGLATSTPDCDSSTYNTAVPLSWTGSSALDADGNYVVGYYGVFRSTNGGAYSLAGSTSGGPPATTYNDDTATDALPTTTYYYTSGNTLDADYGGTTTAIGTYDFGAQENLIASTTTPSGSWTYVAESGTTNHNVLVVDSLHSDANYDKIVSTVTLAGTGPVPIAVAVAPNGTAAYVLDKTNDKVDVIPVPTPATYTVTTTISVGTLGSPAALAVTPNSSELLVANYSAGTVTVINTATDTVTATVTVPKPTGGKAPAPMGIVVLPSSADAYVVDRSNNEVDELSLTGATANTFVAEDAVGSQGATGAETPAGVGLVQNPNGSTEIYVGDSGTDEVSVIATASNTVTNVGIGTANAPVALVAAPDGCYVAVAQSNSPFTVYLISSTTNAVLKTLTGTAATCLAMQGDSSAYLETSGSAAAVPTLVSYELQAASTTAGGGFKSALSSAVSLSLGAGQVP